jgi:hypothetical protein
MRNFFCFEFSSAERSESFPPSRKRMNMTMKKSSLTRRERKNNKNKKTFIHFSKLRRKKKWICELAFPSFSFHHQLSWNISWKSAEEKSHTHFVYEKEEKKINVISAIEFSFSLNIFSCFWFKEFFYSWIVNKSLWLSSSHYFALEQRREQKILYWFF